MSTIFSNVKELDVQSAMGIIQIGELNGQKVLIKRIKPHLKNKQEQKKLFFKQFESATKLSHPQIITPIAKGEDDDGAYFYANYPDARLLSEIINEGGVQDISLLKKMVMQLVDVLSYAHSKQVIHKDLRPDNIYVTSNNELKVFDFGLSPASAYDDNMVKSGSQKYSAPEHLAKQNLLFLWHHLQQY